MFLPPNTTSKVQPMDQGIIQSMKLKFHKRQSQKILAEMEKKKDVCGTDLLKQISILDAIYWIKHTWDEVETSTIIKCFQKSGFVFSETEDNVISVDINDDIPLSLVNMANELFGYDFSDLVEIEQSIPTCDESMDWDKPASELLSENETVTDESDDESDETDQTVPVCTLNEVEEYLEKLKVFALAKGQTKMLTNVIWN